MPKRAPSDRPRTREFRTRRALVRYLDGPNGYRWNWYRDFDPPLSADEDFRPGAVATFVACAPPTPVVAPAFAREVIRRFRWTVSEPRLWHGPEGATSLTPLGFHPISWPRSPRIVVYLGHTAHLSGEVWQVEELPSMIAPVEPHVDEYSISIGFASWRIPTPQQWIEMGAAQGLRLHWVAPDNEPVATFHVPPDYGDYSLALEGSADGVRLIAFDDFPHRCSLSFSGSAAEDHLVHRFIAAFCALPDARVSTGNCTFTGPEWLRYRRTKRLRRPEPERPVAAAILPLRRS